MTFPFVLTDPNVTCQVVAENLDRIVLAFGFEKASEGRLDNHPHVPATYVESGWFSPMIGDDTQVFGPGDRFVIPSKARHSGICHTCCSQTDTYSPCRNDFL